MLLRMARIHLRRLMRARKKLEDARQERDNAIREAYASGETQKDIARIAGLSQQRVAQIVAER